jgi:hypothetical protein
MAKMGGYNPQGYSGKYSGKAGRNPGRNPQPGFGGGGGGGNKGCGGKKRVVPALAIIVSVPVAAVWGTVELIGSVLG